MSYLLCSVRAQTGFSGKEDIPVIHTGLWGERLCPNEVKERQKALETQVGQHYFLRKKQKMEGKLNSGVNFREATEKIETLEKRAPL